MSLMRGKQPQLKLCVYYFPNKRKELTFEIGFILENKLTGLVDFKFDVYF